VSEIVGAPVIGANGSGVLAERVGEEREGQIGGPLAPSVPPLETDAVQLDVIERTKAGLIPNEHLALPLRRTPAQIDAVARPGARRCVHAATVPRGQSVLNRPTAVWAQPEDAHTPSGIELVWEGQVMALCRDW